jgi:hypothetical protein
MPSETLRDLIGDYGVEFGPIIKLIGIKIYFCLYILQVLAIGVMTELL